MGGAQTVIASEHVIRILRFIGAVALLVMAGPSVAYLWTSLQPEWALSKDFGQEYLLARAVADGVNPYLDIRDLATRYLAPVGLLDKAMPTPHPPSIGVLFLPLLVVDYPTAVQVWFAVQVVCLFVGVALILRITRLPVNLAWVLVIAFALLAWRPVLVDLALGQVTIVILALLVASEFMLQHRHERITGVLLGVSLLFKPLAWPWLLVLLWRRNWSTIAACLAVAVVGFSLPAVRVGIGPMVTYFADVLPSVSRSYAAEPTNISLWTIGSRLFGLSEVGRLVGAAIPFGVVAITLVWLRTRPPLGVALGVATWLSILVSPISWQYSLVLLLLPIAVLVNQLRQRGFPRPITAVTLMAVAALCAPMDAWPTELVSTTLASAVGVLLMWSSTGEALRSVPTQDDIAHAGVVLAGAAHGDFHSRAS